MGEVSRRAFLVSGSAGAVAIAGVASGGLGTIGLAAAEEGELTPEELDAVATPMLLHVRDAAAGLFRHHDLYEKPWFDDLAVRGQRPVLAIVVEIEQVFSHCPKAFLRSRLWTPESWPSAEGLPSVAALTKAVQSTPETLEELEAHYAVQNYSKLLY